MAGTMIEELSCIETKPGITHQLYILKEVSSLQATLTLCLSFAFDYVFDWLLYHSASYVTRYVISCER